MKGRWVRFEGRRVFLKVPVGHLQGPVGLPQVPVVFLKCRWVLLRYRWVSKTSSDRGKGPGGPKVGPG